jgi:hypothetical protein
MRKPYTAQFTTASASAIAGTDMDGPEPDTTPFDAISTQGNKLLRVWAQRKSPPRHDPANLPVASNTKPTSTNPHHMSPTDGRRQASFSSYSSFVSSLHKAGTL